MSHKFKYFSFYSVLHIFFLLLLLLHKKINEEKWVLTVDGSPVELEART
jgi:hypothetical protein